VVGLKLHDLRLVLLELYHCVTEKQTDRQDNIYHRAIAELTRAKKTTAEIRTVVLLQPTTNLIGLNRDS